MRRIVKGDHAALSELYDRYGQLVYSLTLRVTGSAPLAEEATQDTFLKVWQQRATWDANRGKFSSWLLTVARYTAIDLLRHEKNRFAHVELHEEVDFVADHQDQTHPSHRHDLRLMLDELPEEQRQLIELAFYKGMTHRTLAKRLNLPLGTVKTRIRLGLHKLRSLLKDEVPED